MVFVTGTTVYGLVQFLDSSTLVGVPGGLLGGGLLGNVNLVIA